jgi:ribonucleotide reductase beta subunit family protein with ferritin-like domain
MELCCHQSLLNLSSIQDATGTVFSQLMQTLNYELFTRGTQVANFWTPEAIDFSDDMKHPPTCLQTKYTSFL